MSLPGNGIFIVRSEVSTLLTAVNRSKWISIASQNESEGAVLRSLMDLKQHLMATDDLKTLPARHYFRPFLGIIRSEKTSGQLTSLALGTVYKILTYGILGAEIDDIEDTAELMDEIAEAATHTRFVGSDQATDGVVLLRVVQVLKLLMLGPEGKFLSNGSICEIMLCCFRICFEPKLNELLRRTAESALKDMVLSLFVQLPNFVEEEGTTRPLRISGNLIDSATKSQSQSSLKVEVTEATPEATPEIAENTPLLTTPLPLASRLIDVHGTTTPRTALTSTRTPRRLQTDREVASLEPEIDERPAFQPYGMPCVRELFPFLISLCDPTDKQNTDTMIHTGLTLLMVAFETASPHIAHFPSLLSLVQNDLCKNLIALLDTDRISILAADLQLCFLIFESMRSYLKFQLEKYLLKLCGIISSETGRIQYESRELVLDNLIQFWKVRYSDT